MDTQELILLRKFRAAALVMMQDIGPNPHTNGVIQISHQIENHYHNVKTRERRINTSPYRAMVEKDRRDTTTAFDKSVKILELANKYGVKREFSLNPKPDYVFSTITGRWIEPDNHLMGRIDSIRNQHNRDNCEE
jgi:hypothetical protein